MDELTSKFNRVYANMPLGMRSDVALLLDGKPISWDAAYLEVDSETTLAPAILKQLNKLGLI